MAKKVRRDHSTHKPGGQGPSHSKKTSGSAEPSAEATEVEVTTADTGVDIDAAMDSVVMETTEVVVAEPVAAPTRKRRSRRGAKSQAESLAGRTASDGVYERADLRRIGMVSGLLLVAMLVAWVLLVPMNLAGLY